MLNSLCVLFLLLVALGVFKLFWDLVMMAVRRDYFRSRYTDEWILKRAVWIQQNPPAYTGRNAEKQRARDEWAMDVVNDRNKGA